MQSVYASKDSIFISSKSFSRCDDDSVDSSYIHDYKNIAGPISINMTGNLYVDNFNGILAIKTAQLSSAYINNNCISQNYSPSPMFYWYNSLISSEQNSFYYNRHYSDCIKYYSYIIDMKGSISKWNFTYLVDSTSIAYLAGNQPGIFKGSFILFNRFYDSAKITSKSNFNTTLSKTTLNRVSVCIFQSTNYSISLSNLRVQDNSRAIFLYCTISNSYFEMPNETNYFSFNNSVLVDVEFDSPTQIESFKYNANECQLLYRSLIEHDYLQYFGWAALTLGIVAVASIAYFIIDKLITAKRKKQQEKSSLDMSVNTDEESSQAFASVPMSFVYFIKVSCYTMSFTFLICNFISLFIFVEAVVQVVVLRQVRTLFTILMVDEFKDQPSTLLLVNQLLWYLTHIPLVTLLVYTCARVVTGFFKNIFSMIKFENVKILIACIIEGINHAHDHKRLIRWNIFRYSVCLALSIIFLITIIYSFLGVFFSDVHFFHYQIEIFQNSDLSKELTKVLVVSFMFIPIISMCKPVIQAWKMFLCKSPPINSNQEHTRLLFGQEHQRLFDPCDVLIDTLWSDFVRTSYNNLKTESIWMKILYFLFGAVALANIAIFLVIKFSYLGFQSISNELSQWTAFILYVVVNIAVVPFVILANIITAFSSKLSAFAHVQTKMVTTLIVLAALLGVYCIIIYPIIILLGNTSNAAFRPAETKNISLNESDPAFWDYCISDQTLLPATCTVDFSYITHLNVLDLIPALILAQMKAQGIDEEYINTTENVFCPTELRGFRNYELLAYDTGFILDTKRELKTKYRHFEAQHYTYRIRSDELYAYIMFNTMAGMHDYLGYAFLLDTIIQTYLPIVFEECIPFYQIVDKYFLRSTSIFFNKFFADMFGIKASFDYYIDSSVNSLEPSHFNLGHDIGAIYIKTISNNRAWSFNTISLKDTTFDSETDTTIAVEEAQHKQIVNFFDDSMFASETRGAANIRLPHVDLFPNVYRTVCSIVAGCSNDDKKHEWCHKTVENYDAYLKAWGRDKEDCSQKHEI